MKDADGTSAQRKIFTAPGAGYAGPLAWSPDGFRIIYLSQAPKTDTDLWILPMTGDGKPVPFVATPAGEGDNGVGFSPDGRYLAYLSDESGRWEIYVAPFPGPGGKRQISTGGAQRAWWRGAGTEIFYLDLEGKFFAVPVTESSARLEIGARRPLFGGQVLALGPSDFTHDGKRFLTAVTVAGDTGLELTLVTNWASELEKK